MLIPELETAESVVRDFVVGEKMRLSIRVLESSRYTRFLHLSGQVAETPWLGMQSMSLRMYLDARMVEVESCGAERVRLLRYPYPNAQMYSANEKNELNQFLGQWLDHFIRLGSVDCDSSVDREY